MTTDTEALRAEFEAWANGILALAYDCEKGRYVDGYSETCFQCWQAARRTQPPACAADDGWQPIETAPNDTAVLLAWWSNWSEEWKMEVDFAGSTRGCWRHGSATYWRPLPKPPADKGAPDA